MDDEIEICDDCGEEMEGCCDGIVRCLSCSFCPGCSDGPGPGGDDEPDGFRSDAEADADALMSVYGPDE